MGNRPTGWNFEIRPGGWMRAKHIRDKRVAYFRLGAPDEGGPWIVRETHLTHTESQSVVGWRDIPFKTAESVARRPHIRRVLEMPAADGAPSWPGDPDAYFRQQDDGTYYSALVATLEDDSDGEGPEFPLRGFTTDGEITPVPLRAPEPGRLTDEFLTAVAEWYLWLVDRKRHPAPAIAEQTGRPVQTVHGWVRQARLRGLLPPALGTTAG